MTNRPAGLSRNQAVLSDDQLERRVQAYAAFAAGLVAQDNSAADQALGYFAKSLAADPTNESLALEVARQYLDRKQNEQALVLLRRTAALPGASGAAKSFLALTCLQLGRKDEAMAAYRDALKESPGLLANYQGLVQLLSERQRPDEALQVLEGAAKQAVDNPDYWVGLADLFAELGKRPSKLGAVTKTRALAALAKAVALKPDEPVLLQRMGERYESLGQVTQAEGLFKQLRERFPHNALPTAKLAELYLRQGRPKEAREQLEALKRESPTNPQPYYYLGLIAFDEHDLERAVESFERALLLDSGFEPAYADLATARLSQAKPELALTTLAKAKTKFPDDFRREYLAAIAEQQLKHFDEALARFLAAEKLGKEKQPAAVNHRFYFQIGTMLERAGRMPEAETYLLKSLDLKPDYDEALNYLGYSWADRGINLKRAHDMIGRAVKAEPDNAAYLDSLGWVLFKLGRAQDAVAPLEKALKLLPESDAAVLDHLADVLLSLGRREAARTMWRKSLDLEKSEPVQRKFDALK